MGSEVKQGASPWGCTAFLGSQVWGTDSPQGPLLALLLKAVSFLFSHLNQRATPRSQHLPCLCPRTSTRTGTQPGWLHPAPRLTLVEAYLVTKDHHALCKQLVLKANRGAITGLQLP